MPENTSRENNKQGGGGSGSGVEELESVQAQPTQPQRRPTLLRVPSISNQDVAGVNNNDVVFESVSRSLFQ